MSWNPATDWVKIGNLWWSSKDIDIEVPGVSSYQGVDYALSYLWDRGEFGSRRYYLAEGPNEYNRNRAGIDALKALVPAGSRIPTRADLDNLIAALGGTSYAGLHLKATDFGGDNSSGMGITGIGSLGTYYIQEYNPIYPQDNQGSGNYTEPDPPIEYMWANYAYDAPTGTPYGDSTLWGLQESWNNVNVGDGGYPPREYAAVRLVRDTSPFPPVRKLYLGSAGSWKEIDQLAPTANTGKVLDTRDGKWYKTVLMPDGKWWFAESLAWDGSGYDYADNPTNRAIYGRLYKWSSALIVPPGTHLPTDAEWSALEAAIVAPDGTKLKAVSPLWSINTGTDEFGFSAIPGGQRTTGGAYAFIQQEAYFWTASALDTTRAYKRSLAGGSTTVSAGVMDKNIGAAVRLIVDSGNIPDGGSIFVGQGGEWKKASLLIGDTSGWK